MSPSLPSVDLGDVAFRSAIAADLPAIIRLIADDGIGRGREDASEPLDPAYLKAFAAMMVDPNQQPVVADLAGEIVGYMQLTFIPGLSRRGMTRCLVESVRVAGRLRGKGLGRRMFLHAEAEARSRGCGLIQLTTDKQRAEARRFYESLGYAASHEGMKRSLTA